MAKLYSYYGLCPLIDPTSLLGVSEDCVPGCVIVTLGKNIVIRYKLSDQKQISSWSTRDRLTSPVVYDRQDQKYIAAFANNQCRVWSADETNLDRVKKLKFQPQIHTIMTQQDAPSIIIFRNGTCSSLEKALKNRKEVRENVIHDTDTIKDQVLLTARNQMFICYLVKSKENLKSCLVMELETANYTEKTNTIKIQKIHRSDNQAKLIGYSFLPDEENSQLLTIWSDGRLYSLNLFLENLDPSVGCLLSGVEALSSKSPIVMTPLNSNYVVMYGADPNQEGASLIIYNIQFKIMQSRQRFKLFGHGAKLTAIGNCILLAAGQSLAVVPFNMETEQLAAIVGSKMYTNVIDDDVKIVSDMKVVDWSIGDNIITKKINNAIFQSTMPNMVQILLKDLNREGYSELGIVEQILPQLLERKNMEELLWSIHNFKDIPEHLLVKLLSFILTSPDSVFITHKSNDDQIDHPHCLNPTGRRQFVNVLLNVSFSDVNLLPHLQVGLKFPETIKLLKYLSYIVSENNSDLKICENTFKSENKIYEWASLLLDSHYQEYLLSREDDILNILVHLKKIISGHLHFVSDAKSTLSLLERIKIGKPLSKNNQYQSSKWYSIEQIQLY